MGENEAPSFEDLLEPLTDKQAAFVREYLIDLNASAAARRAGYSKSTAYSIGHENLTKPHIAAAIQAGKDARARRLDVTADRVLEELAYVGFSRLSDVAQWGPDGPTLIDSGELDDAALASVREVARTTGRSSTIKIKQHDKIRALKLLAEHTGITRSESDSRSPRETAREIRDALREIDDVTAPEATDDDAADE